MVPERAHYEDGFTLLEVIVALAIAALALVGLFQAASGGLCFLNASIEKTTSSTVIGLPS